MSPQYAHFWADRNDGVTAYRVVRVWLDQIVLWGSYSLDLKVVFLLMRFKMLLTFSVRAKVETLVLSIMVFLVSSTINTQWKTKM